MSLAKLFGGIKPITEKSDGIKLVEDSATFYQNYQRFIDLQYEGVIKGFNIEVNFQQEQDSHHLNRECLGPLLGEVVSQD